MKYTVYIDGKRIATVYEMARAISYGKSPSRNNRKVSVKDKDGNLVYFCA